MTFKLAAYRHENEVRLMTPIHNPGMSRDNQRNPSPWWNNPSGSKDVTLLPIGEIANIVAGVMAGPSASDSLQRELEALCKSEKIQYEGKSTLRTERYTGSTRIFNYDPNENS